MGQSDQKMQEGGGGETGVRRHVEEEEGGLLLFYGQNNALVRERKRERGYIHIYIFIETRGIWKMRLTGLKSSRGENEAQTG